MIEHPESRALPAGLLHLLVVYVVWGSTYLAIRVAVRPGHGVPPFALGALRLVVAGAVLLAWGLAKKWRLRLTEERGVTLAVAGLLLWPCANGLVNLAEQRVDSGYAALLVATVPIWTALDRRPPRSAPPEVAVRCVARCGVCGSRTPQRAPTPRGRSGRCALRRAALGGSGGVGGGIGSPEASVR